MTHATSPPKVRVFFYGSFINREVPAQVNLMPESVEVARLERFRDGPLPD